MEPAVVLARRLAEKMSKRAGPLKTAATIIFSLLITSQLVIFTTDESKSGSLAYGSSSHSNSDKTIVLVPSNQLSTETTSSAKTNVTLKALFDNLDNPGRWNKLLQPALDELARRHPDLNIQVAYNEYYYNETRSKILHELSINDNTDIVSIDQIWLGDFAERGLITNLTDNFVQWNRSSDLYEAYLDGCVYNNSVYGLWLWTDVRGLWYWKDMLNKAGVDPASLKTWDGYISAEAKLKQALGNNITQGIHLISASHDPDLWYPYLWMLGGEILEFRKGHPSKDVYWFPSYNDTEGVQALDFLKRQVDAGIRPQSLPAEKEFVDKKFAVILAGSWIPGEFPEEMRPKLEEEVGFIPMFPVRDQNTQTTTLIGGWELAIPASSNNKDLSWELITLMAEPDILAPFLQEYGYLPTQKVLGDGPLSEPLKESVPFYEEMVSMIQYGRSRPNIPEYPEIADDIHNAIQQVYNGAATPEQALDSAAAESADSLGWRQ